jgi:hypothetical protein
MDGALKFIEKAKMLLTSTEAIQHAPGEAIRHGLSY